MTQKDMVLDYMNQYGSISTLEAFRDLGITRLSARIFELKEHGIRIGSKWTTSKNRFGKKVAFMTYYIEQG